MDINGYEEHAICKRNWSAMQVLQYQWALMCRVSFHEFKDQFNDGGKAKKNTLHFEKKSESRLFRFFCFKNPRKYYGIHCSTCECIAYIFAFTKVLFLILPHSFS